MATQGPELLAEIADFLFLEAGLLDAGRLEDWLGLLTDDVRYVMPVRRNVQPAPGGAAAPEETFSLYNEDKASLLMRVRRIGTGVAHAEAPPSVTQRMISNIRVAPGAGAEEMLVQSNFLVYQERRGRFGTTFIGKRHDRLRREGGGLKIAERRIALAQSILPTTISIFF